MIKLRSLFLVFITYLPSIICQIPSNCNQSCPGSKFTQVPYPFGFSYGCEIQLNCTSNGTVQLVNSLSGNSAQMGYLSTLPPSAAATLTLLAFSIAKTMLRYLPTLSSWKTAQSRQIIAIFQCLSHNFAL